ncbi:hypothetical protein MOU_20860, partial [Xanthomonas citri pv. malvacearum str. GSPB1386]
MPRLRLCRHFGKVDDAGNGEACTLVADRRYEALGFDQWQAADPIDLFSNDHFARLQREILVISADALVNPRVLPRFHG